MAASSVHLYAAAYGEVQGSSSPARGVEVVPLATHGPIFSRHMSVFVSVPFGKM